MWHAEAPVPLWSWVRFIWKGVVKDLFRRLMGMHRHRQGGESQAGIKTASSCELTHVA
jgi:hypothetical protein